MLSESQIRAVLRAYDDCVSLQAISILFKLTQHEIINLVHMIKCVRKINYDENRRLL